MRHTGLHRSASAEALRNQLPRSATTAPIAAVALQLELIGYRYDARNLPRNALRSHKCRGTPNVAAEEHLAVLGLHIHVPEKELRIAIESALHLVCERPIGPHLCKRFWGRAGARHAE